MRTGLDRHPLTVLLAQKGWTADMFLRRVAARHQALGYGPTGTRKQKVYRWTSPRQPVLPKLTVQLAMADLLGIEASDVHRHQWPGWLLLASCNGPALLDSPWTPAGTMTVLAQAARPRDRRGFLALTTAALTPLLAQWATAPAATAATRGRRVGGDVVALISSRLDALHHLDDHVGPAQAYAAAIAELRLITQLLREASYTEQVGRQLFSAAAMASRQAGWCAYDQGRAADAERHLVTALRAAASAGDDTAGAIALAFWANVRYAGGDPRGAIDLTSHALARKSKIGSPRAITMLHARRARAYSLTSEPLRSYQEIDSAFAAYHAAGPATDDLPALYWISAGELHQVAGSAALSLRDPARALAHFDAALRDRDPYDALLDPRGTAIYLARRAEAHLALSDLDSAVGAAWQAVTALGGITSARGTTTLTALKDHLMAYRHVPIVREFLDCAR